MKKNPKLSIIVPVYKVEKYLSECIDSVLASDFTDFEVILVDDGSPDGCGKICDEYANNHARVRTIHKENGGLSSARNAGLDIATGNIVAFVDSDDRVMPQMFSHMVSELENENADIVCCGMRLLRDDGVITPFKPWPQEKEVYEGADCLQLLLDRENGSGDFYMNKVYRRELFEGFRLPEGKVFEDIFSMHFLFEKSKKTVFLPEGLYEYRLLPNSLSHSKGFTPRSLDFPAACREQYIFIKEKYPKFTALATEKYVFAILMVARSVALSDEKSKNDLLRGFADDLRGMGTDLDLVSDENVRKKCRALMRGAGYWIRRCRKVKFYEDQHNHPKLQAILKPFLRPW